MVAFDAGFGVLRELMSGCSLPWIDPAVNAAVVIIYDDEMLSLGGDSCVTYTWRATAEYEF